VLFRTADDIRQSCLAIPPFRRKYFVHLTFVIDRSPQIMRLAVDPNENLVQVPAPVRIRMMMNPSLADRSSEHRAEPVPPETHRLVAHVDAAFEQQILDLAQ
jgi:hypothetical protein